LVQCKKALAKVANDRETTRVKNINAKDFRMGEPLRVFQKGRGRCAMTRVEMVIDSVRRSVASDKWTVVLKEKEAERYLPICVGSAQADIIKRELVGPTKSPAPDLFLAGINASDSKVEYAVITQLEDNVFHARLLLSSRAESYEVNCPTAMSLALAARGTDPPIFVDEEVLNKAGVTLPSYPMSTTPKQPWWRRLLQRQG
jgi:bifunctional DNase/RNase